MNVISSSRFDEIVKQFPIIKPIVVVGDVGLDKYTYGEVARISPEAPVPVLEVSREWFKLGMASNVSDNLKSLGVNTTLCGVVGEDVSGSMFGELLAKGGLTNKGIVIDYNRKTSLKERVTTNTQQICRVDHETRGPVADETCDKLFDLVDSIADSHSALILEDYAKGLFNESFCRRLIDCFRERKMLITVDPSRLTPPLWYRGATLLKPNKVESELIASSLGYRHEKNLERVAEIIIEKLEIEKLLITLGSDGMAMVDTCGDGKFRVIPTVAKEVFDVSGAGDTAISAITSSLVAGSSLEEAAWIGNCASGIAVGKKGTASVSIDELKRFHKKLVVRI